jgi:hydrogenase-4 component B
MLFAFLAMSVALYVVAAFASLAWRGNEGRAAMASGICGGVAAVLGLCAAVPVLLDGAAASTAWATPFPFAAFTLRLDALAAFMVLAISLLAAATSVFGLAYVAEYAGRGIGAMGFFMNLFIAAMLLVVVADNAMWFLVFFEMMSLTSYFLVIFDQDDAAVAAGWLYFVVAHAGSVLIMIAFLLLFAQTGSLEFEAFRHAAPSAPLASCVFLLAFFGFGAKAGMIPIHVWLARAHPAAPSHASALMSGVMIKIGVFGIIKVGVDLLGAGTPWWGLLVLAFGAVSSVLGVIYALEEHDIKRLLAFHSVENIGIILMGVGIGMVGIAVGQPVLAVLGLLAGLYHLLNHAVFKGLLFLGAGAVISRVHSRDMDEMGGLAHRMPWTALCFLVGALAIAAMPPLNGFVSEWFTYQALFNAALHGSLVVRVLAPTAAVMLAITGALAVMAFVKAYGVTFSGVARSAHADAATEVKPAMLIGMGALAVLCVLFGLGAPALVPIVRNVAASLVGHGIEVAHGALVFPGDAAQGALSPGLIALLLVGLLGLPLVITGLFAGRRPSRRVNAEAWACGYAHDAGMNVSAGGFTQPIRVLFRPLYAMRDTADDALAVARAGFERFAVSAGRVEPMGDHGLLVPIGRGVHAAGERLQVLQGGDVRVYCVYIVVALVVLLLATVG